MDPHPALLSRAAVEQPTWLQGWLDWVDAALHREILRVRARYQLSIDELRGLYISDEQVDQLMAEQQPDCHDVFALDRYCRDRVAELHETSGPLREVAQEFGLTDAEVCALIICLAPEVNLHYQALFAYLNDDVTRRLPTVDLCQRLGDGGWALLDPASAIFAGGLVEPVRSAGTIWRATGLLLRDPVRTFLLDIDARPAANQHRVLLVQGDDGAQTAASLGAEEGRDVLTVTAELCAPGQERALADLLVRARLHGSVVHAAAPCAVPEICAAPVTLVLGHDWRPHLAGVTHERVCVTSATPATRAHATHALETLAQRVELTYDWDDLVLPRPTEARLRELGSAIAAREQVFSGWGFRRLSGGHSSLRVLFTGSSGTGKTMSAAVLAREVGLELFQVDLSAVVSKYIGETEKNLERIFSAAEGSGALLFFDEADALFGKRSDVTDAHDRYANIEASYLLQRIERYDGMLILATNLSANMDEAFSRRLHGEIEFPLPDEKARNALWHKAVPLAAPVAGDIDHRFLARQFPLTGGEIRNVALSAAFLAAHERVPISMVHLLRALARQRHRQGRLSSYAEFGEYMQLVRSEGG
jgi:hypothetical protein